MKVAVMNFSGNVGKSTVARHLFMPRIKDAEYIAVESINADEGESEEIMRGKQFGQLQEDLMMLDAAIVDVGASNVEDFIKLMQQYRGSHEEFDFFVIPAVSETKQVKDTIGTIQALAAMGVPAKKIRVVFNKVDVDEDPTETFYAIQAYHDDAKKFTYREKAVIYNNELFHKMRFHNVNITTLLDDKTDWRANLKTAKSPEEKEKAIAMISMRRLAISAKENLDAVYTALMK